MSLQNYSREELEVTSMLELANEILHDKQKAKDFHDLYNQVVEMKEFTEEQRQEYIGQFYTDLTIDGRFLTIGSGVWGLKRWYPVEQMDEIISPAPKKKKKKAKVKKNKKEEEEAPREESKEENLDAPTDNVEVLTDTFDEEILDDTEELGGYEGFDDEFEEVDDEFDAEEEADESNDENDEEENK
ncbi:DNA-directed RNA polymerase subunit delta [Lentibacillus sp. CBA3610]|uniref:DNA-directed RNA polymerase subunit delta n=1 Tax=Lentibacillus sp. CBA3610 TaxID=2518176 RepID=UPI001595DB97|nr:DNA-directed RNA polymerase subunit delta [Lentibacillus sp. CBA3610]QKY70497.1 DNA-directed RNA polymerase subunit delta [Lentibacillus sp. CBA3610]